MKKQVYVITCAYGLVGVTTNVKKIYEGLKESAESNNETLYMEEYPGVDSQGRHVVNKLKFTYNNLTKKLRNKGYTTIYIEGREESEAYKVDSTYLNNL